MYGYIDLEAIYKIVMAYPNIDTRTPFTEDEKEYVSYSLNIENGIYGCTISSGIMSIFEHIICNIENQYIVFTAIQDSKLWCEDIYKLFPDKEIAHTEMFMYNIGKRKTWFTYNEFYRFCVRIPNHVFIDLLQSVYFVMSDDNKHSKLIHYTNYETYKLDKKKQNEIKKPITNNSKIELK